MDNNPKREHFAHFCIAGFTYYEGAFVLGKLKAGEELRLVPEPENRFDKNAIALYYEDMKIGFVPKGQNREMSKVLNAGYPIFRAIIQMVDTTCNPEEQVQVIVFIERSKV